jgi:cytochrome P450
MARHVAAPVTIDVGDAVYEVGAGATVATLLPLTNTSAAPGLEVWDPGRWNRRRLADPSALAAVELVTVFGHGRHTCPAQPFSLATMTAAAARLFTAFDMEPGWTDHPHPVRNQIGGVARAAGPCPVRYRRR